MKPVYIITLALALIIATVILYKDGNRVEAKNTTNGFAVVELFTSEGCSSCPPADAALAKVSEEYAGKVFALEFHVDYWDRLGWKDEFSNHTYTQRQGNYSKQFHLNSVYTPQAVVNGKTEFTGSNTNALHKAINKELGSAGNINIDLKASLIGNNVSVQYKIDEASSSVLNIALVQLRAQSNVTRGENAGSVLAHANVVREFITVNVSSTAAGNTKLTLPEHTTAKDFAVIAYLQNASTGAISGAKEVIMQ